MSEPSGDAAHPGGLLPQGSLADLGPDAFACLFARDGAVAGASPAGRALVARLDRPSRARIAALAAAVSAGAPPAPLALRAAGRTFAALARPAPLGQGVGLLVQIDGEPPRAWATPGAPRVAVPPVTPPEATLSPLEQFRKAAGDRPTLRFVWHCHPDGRVASLSPALLRAVPEAADAIGRSWAELGEMIVGADSLDAHVRSGRAWSGVASVWRLANGALVAPVELGGAPMRDANGLDAGQRGYGLLRVSAVTEAPSKRPAPEPEPTEKPVGVGVAAEASAPATPEVPVIRTNDPAPAEVRAGEAPVTAPSQPQPENVDWHGGDAREAAQERGGNTPRHDAPAPPKAGALSPGERQTLRDIAQALAAVARGQGDEGTPRKPAAAIAHTASPTSPARAAPLRSLRDVVQDVTGKAAEAAPVERQTSDGASDAAPVASPPQAPDEARSAPVPEAQVQSVRQSDVPERAADPAVQADAAAEAVAVDAGRYPGAAARWSPSDAAPPSAAGQGVLPGFADDSPERMDVAAVAQPPAGPEQMPPANDATPSSATPPAQVRATRRDPVAEMIASVAADADGTADRKAAREPEPVMPAHEALRQLVQQAPAPVLVSRGDEVIHANQAFVSLTRHGGMADLMAAGRSGLLPDAPAQRSFSGRATLVGARGVRTPVLLISLPAPWRDGDVQLTFAMRDDSAEAEARARHLEAEASRQAAQVSELTAILNTATDGVLMLDPHGRILSVNRAAEALFGFEQNELVGEPITRLLDGASHQTAMDYLVQVRGGGVAGMLNDGREIVGRVRQGGACQLFMTIGKVDAAGGQRFCAVLRDVTAWKKTEHDLIESRERAEAANAQKSDFLARMSHEVRTPLGAMIGFAELMLEERLGPIANPRYREYVRDIHESGQYVISLVNDLLDLARIEAGKMELNFTSVDLNAILTSCVTLMQPQAAKARIVLRSSLDPDLPPVVADERSMRQITLNVLGNALKFTDAGGQVIVSSLRNEAGEVVIRVRDTGIGMTEEETKEALKPFRRLARGRKAPGTGLGLPLTVALAEANRGALRISSKPGEGTLVEIALPTTRVLAH